MSSCNNVHWWYEIDKFAPSFVTVPKGTEIRSVVSQDDYNLRVYVHTRDYKTEANIPVGVELAKSLNNWEVYEFRVFRAPMHTPDLSKWTFLGTVQVRSGKCINHVYYRRRNAFLE